VKFDTIETNVNPFCTTSRLAVVKRDGTIGYIRVNNRGGEKDKLYGSDGKEINDGKRDKQD